MKIRWPGMRYTKSALLLFGLGLVLGFVVVVIGGYPRLGRLASALMAVGLVLLPLGLLADGRGMKVVAWVAARLSRRKRTKPRATSRPAAARRKPSAKPPGKPPGKPPAKPPAKPGGQAARRKRR